MAKKLISIELSTRFCFKVDWSQARLMQRIFLSLRCSIARCNRKLYCCSLHMPVWNEMPYHHSYHQETPASLTIFAKGQFPLDPVRLDGRGCIRKLFPVVCRQLSNYRALGLRPWKKSCLLSSLFHQKSVFMSWFLLLNCHKPWRNFNIRNGSFVSREMVFYCDSLTFPNANIVAFN